MQTIFNYKSLILMILTLPRRYWRVDLGPSWRGFRDW